VDGKLNSASKDAFRFGSPKKKLVPRQIRSYNPEDQPASAPASMKPLVEHLINDKAWLNNQGRCRYFSKSLSIFADIFGI
jgi:hypothetical protein